MGDIKKSIRKTISNRLKEATSKWSPNAQPNIYELANFLMKSGYRLVDVLTENGSPEILIEAIRPSYLYPDIVHDIVEGTFNIKVEGYGLMIASDLEEVMKGYTNALAVLKHLETIDLFKLEVDLDDK